MLSGVSGYDQNIELNKKKLPKNLDWPNCRILMKEPQKLINKLSNFHNEINNGKVPPQNFAKIKPYFKEQIFQQPKLMFKKSPAAGNILLFLTCMVEYYDAMTQMIPKRKALQSANDKLDLANSNLARIKEEVHKLQEALKILVKKFDKASAEKNAAIAEAEKCSFQLNMAERLVSALSSEKDRWRTSIETLEEQISVVVGDVLLASGFISYAGPFSKRFREKLVFEEFVHFIKKKQIPKSQISNPVKLLVDDATTAEWNNQGLPSDRVSIENGAILVNSQRYPLMIDPQLQGIAWIKEKEKDNGLLIMRIGSKNYIFKLERAI